MSVRLQVPTEIAPLIAAIVDRASPKAVWLFGSRARGDHRLDSDWDLAVALDDNASPELFDPMTYWALHRRSGVQATIIPVSVSDLAECWGQPNTIGFDLAREGRRLDVVT